MIRAALGITWPETISTAELTLRANLIPLSRTIRMHRLRLVGHMIRMQSWCQTPLSTLMTTVPLNCHLRQGHVRASTLQHNVADDLRSINCDVTSISGMTKSCFFSLVDTLEDLLALMSNVRLLIHRIHHLSLKQELDESPTLQGTIKAIVHLLCRLAAGVDGMPSEVWKLCGLMLHVKPYNLPI